MIVTQAQISENFALLVFTRKFCNQVRNDRTGAFLSFSVFHDSWRAHLSQKNADGKYDSEEVKGTHMNQRFKAELDMWQAVQGKEVISAVLNPLSAPLQIPGVGKRIELMEMYGPIEFAARQERLRKDFRDWLNTFATAYGAPAKKTRSVITTAGQAASCGLCLAGSVDLARKDGTLQSIRLRAYAGVFPGTWAITTEAQLNTEDPEETVERAQSARQAIFCEHGLIEAKVY